MWYVQVGMGCHSCRCVWAPGDPRVEVPPPLALAFCCITPLPCVWGSVSTPPSPPTENLFTLLTPLINDYDLNIAKGLSERQQEKTL